MTRFGFGILTTTLVKTLILGVVLSVSACSDDHHHHAGAATGALCPANQTLTYANFGQSFVSSFCLRCHGASVKSSQRMGAPSDHNFDAVDDIRMLAEHIDRHAGSGPVATNTAMPQSDPRPTTEDRRKLAEWLACGAP